MPKINIKVSLKSPKDNLSTTTTAIYQEDSIKYREDDSTKMSFDYQKKVLVRETKELRLHFDFEKELLTIDHKEMNKKIDCKIKVNKMMIKEKDVEIEYTIDHPQEKFIYRIEELK